MSEDFEKKVYNNTFEEHMAYLDSIKKPVQPRNF
jgi:hypothetical protein